MSTPPDLSPPFQAGAADVKNGKGESVFRQAVQDGKWNLVTRLVERSKTASDIALEKVPDGDTILHLLCRKRQTGIVRIFLLKGANPLIIDDNGNTLIHAALKAKKGRKRLIRLLVQAIGKKDTRFIYQELKHLNDSDQSLLLKAGAADVKDTEGNTLMDQGVRETDWDFVTLLLEYSKTAGKIASIRLSDGDTLLHMLCRKGQADIAKRFLINGANPLVIDDEGKTLIHAALKAREGKECLIRVFVQAIGEKDIRFLYKEWKHLNKSDQIVLLKAGAADVEDTEGNTLIYQCVRENDWDFVTPLLEYCKTAAKIASGQMSYGDTLLHLLCRKGQTGIFRIFLRTGTNPLVIDDEGKTLIYGALKARIGKECLIRLLVQAMGKKDMRFLYNELKHLNDSHQRFLLEAGAADVEDTGGNTLMDQGVRENDWDFVTLLLKYSKTAGKIASEQMSHCNTLLHLLCWSRQAEIVHTDLLRKADPSVIDDEGNNTLMHASLKTREGKECLIRLLLQAIGEKDMRFLYNELKYLNKPDQRLLLKAGAADVEDTEGNTLMHQGVRRNDWEFVTLLLEYSKTAGKIASRQMSDGDTLLHMLCWKGQAEIVHTLLLRKANPLVIDKEGNTLMMAALNAQQGSENLIRLLIQAGVAPHQALQSSRTQPFRPLGRVMTNNICHERSPLCRAVRQGQLRIAVMLYHSGACSNKEIHQMPSIMGNHRHDIRQFVEYISSQPRSLRDICAIQISYLIGCGPQREDRVSSLGLPRPLCQVVLHDHVVNPEFLKEYFPDSKVNIDVPYFMVSYCNVFYCFVSRRYDVRQTYERRCSKNERPEGLERNSRNQLSRSNLVVFNERRQQRRKHFAQGTRW